MPRWREVTLESGVSEIVPHFPGVRLCVELPELRGRTDGRVASVFVRKFHSKDPALWLRTSTATARAVDLDPGVYAVVAQHPGRGWTEATVVCADPETTVRLQLQRRGGQLRVERVRADGGAGALDTLVLSQPARGLLLEIPWPADRRHFEWGGLPAGSWQVELRGERGDRLAHGTWSALDGVKNRLRLRVQPDARRFALR